MIILTILAVLLVFTFLVVIHEWGHFVVARRNGVRVDEFGVGFPPRLWGKKKNGVLYSVNALPLGGFVKIKGETGDDKSKDSFSGQRAWVKTKILLAGVTMNLIFAYLLVTLLVATGMPPLITGSMPAFGPVQPHAMGPNHLMVLQVSKDSLAQQAGLKTGDWILSANGEAVTTVEGFRNFTKSHAGSEVRFVVESDQRQRDVIVRLPGQDSGNGIFGVATMPEQLYRYDWWAAPLAAAVMIGQMTWATLAAFGGLITNLFLHAKVSEGVTGPIGITAIFGEVFKFGWRYLIALVASISLSLAIINALPIPALDGGRLLIVVLDKMGLKVSGRVENLVHIAGFAALILLMIIVSVTDITRLR